MGTSYTRRREHVVALALSGLKRSEIADQLGLSPIAVGRTLGTARKRGLLPPPKRARVVTETTRPRLKRETEIIRLAREGMAPRDIATELACQPSTVHHYLWKARREGTFEGAFPRGPGREPGSSTAFLPRSLVIALQPAAAERGVTLCKLAQAILTRVADDGLVNAVLDDEPEERRAAHG